MSNRISNLVQRKKIGSPTLKAVLMYMADKACDEGSGIWVSKTNMAADLELSVRTVQRSVGILLEEGFLRKAGQKPCDSGFTVDYSIDVDALESCDGTRQFGTPVTVSGVTHCQGYPRHSVRGTPDTVSPKPPLEPPLEPLNKNYNKKIQFDEFWRAYPRKTGKIEALRKFEAALKHACAEEIIEGAKKYAASVKETEVQFIAHPRTWLHHGRWADEVAPQSEVGQIEWDEVRRKLGIGT